MLKSIKRDLECGLLTIEQSEILLAMLDEGYCEGLVEKTRSRFIYTHLN